MRRGQADDLLKVIFKTTRYQTEEEAALKLNRNLGARRQRTVGRFEFPTHIITVLDQGGDATSVAKLGSTTMTRYLG